MSQLRPAGRLRVAARRAIFAARHVPWRPIRKAIERLMLRLAVPVDGYPVRVGIFLSHDNVGSLPERLRQMLELVQQVDPMVLERVRRLGVSVLVVRRPGSEYWYETRTIALSSELLMERSAGLAAAVFVHELTHARVATMGVWPWPDLVPRIEAICVRAEITFVRKLPRADYPSTDQFVEYLTKRMNEFGERARRL
jgi:hypothetical protein